MTNSRRTVGVLIVGNIFGGVGVASGIAVGALLVGSVGGTAVAGLGQAMSVLGSAVAAVPLARIAATRSRRAALTLGYLIAVLGAVVVIVSAWAQALIPLLVGLAMFGVSAAANLQTRYAATDVADPKARGRTLSLVVWATTIGSVAGPNLSTAGESLGTGLGLPGLAGPFLFSVLAFAIAATVIGLLLPVPRVADASIAEAGEPTAEAVRDDRVPDIAAAEAGAPGNRTTMDASGRRAAGGSGAAGADDTKSRPRPVSAIAAVRWALGHPVARFALVLIMVAHGVMVGVMSMTPLHIEEHGHGLRVVGIVISLHILGMYALSPVFGMIADRFGAMPVAFAGLGTLAVTFVVGAVAGRTGNVTLTTVALIGLGLGWSMALISSSALFAGVDAGRVRVPLQGATDAFMSYSGALAAILGGPALALIGYSGLNLAAAALLIPGVVIGVVALRARPGRPVMPGVQ